MELENTTPELDEDFADLDRAMNQATALKTKLERNLEVAKIVKEFTDNPNEIKDGLNYLFSAGKFAEVCNVGLLLVENDAADADIFSLLGQSFFAQGYTEPAIKSYRSAKILNPGDAGIKINLAANYASLGDFPSAKQELSEVLDLDPGNALAHLNMGIIHEAENNDDDAAAAFAEAERLDSRLVTEIENAKNSSENEHG